MAQVLRSWGVDKTLPGRVVKDMILEQLEGLECLEESDLMDDGDMTLMDSLKEQFVEILVREEIY